MKKRVKLGIIGIGHLGAFHLKIFHELAQKVYIVGICDVKTARTKRLARHYKTPFFQDYRDLLDKVDAVSLCVPTELHFEIAEFFLKHKKHCFVEKPITKTIEQAQTLIDLAERHKVKLQVGHVERYNAAFESIKHFAREPLFIECHRLNKFPKRSLDIGVVMDLMIHDIDIVLGIVKSPIKEIRAVGVNVLTPLEDIASVRLTFENRCVCNLTASRISDDVMRKIRIFQTDSYISLDYVNQEALIYKKQGTKITKHKLPIEKEQPLKKELAHFADCVLLDQTPYVSGREGKAALKVALDIGAEIWKNRRFTVGAGSTHPGSKEISPTVKGRGDPTPTK